MPFETSATLFIMRTFSQKLLGVALLLALTGSGAASGRHPRSTHKPQETTVPSSSSTKTLQEKGIEAENALDHAIADNAPDTPNRDIFAYYDTDQKDFSVTPDVRTILAHAGAPPPARGDKYQEFTVSTKKDLPGVPAGKKISEFSICHEKGYLVNDYSYNYDKADRTRIYFSDQMFSAWVKVGGGTGLRALIQRNIQNDDTRALVAGFGIKAGSSKSYEKGSKEFADILGSANGLPFVRMLTDHHTHFGDQKIVKIIVFPGSRINILFILG